MERLKNPLIAVLIGVVAFLLGRDLRPDRVAEAAPGPVAGSPAPSGVVLPQGRRGGDKDKKTAPVPLVYESGGGASSTADGFLAVTGSYGVGTSVLYILDTRTKQLAVYEARGGGRNTRRLTLVGARRIDLDLQLEGYNDESEFTYAELRKRFSRKGLTPRAERSTPSKDAGEKAPGK